LGRCRYRLLTEQGRRAEARAAGARLGCRGSNTIGEKALLDELGVAGFWAHDARWPVDFQHLGLPAICDISVTVACNAACDFCGSPETRLSRGLPGTSMPKSSLRISNARPHPSTAPRGDLCETGWRALRIPTPGASCSPGGKRYVWILSRTTSPLLQPLRRDVPVGVPGRR
jgi:hypothetical protein